MYANYESDANVGGQKFARRQQDDELDAPTTYHDSPSISRTPDGRRCSAYRFERETGADCRMQSRLLATSRLKGNILNGHIGSSGQEEESDLRHVQSRQRNEARDVVPSPSFSAHANRLVDDSFNYLDAELKRFDEKEYELLRRQRWHPNSCDALPSETVHRSSYQMYGKVGSSQATLSPHYSMYSPSPTQTTSECVSHGICSRINPEQKAIFSISTETPFEQSPPCSVADNQCAREEDRSQRSSRFNPTPVLNRTDNQSTTATDYLRHVRVPRNAMPPKEVIEMNPDAVTPKGSQNSVYKQFSDIPQNAAVDPEFQWRIKHRRLCTAILLTSLVLAVALVSLAVALYYD